MHRERELPTIQQSEKWIARARAVIPSATQTLAKSPTQYVDGIAPKYLERGKGCHVWDVDGNEYIDLVMGVGTLSLGYCNDAVDRAIRYQLEQGINFSVMHPLEVEVAELVVELVPGAEMVRFSKTGADVTSAAVRLARAFTDRSKVLCCGYHGWHDWYIGTTPRNAGVPAEVSALVQRFAYNYHSMVAFDGTAADPLLCKSLVGQEMIRRGILWNGFHNICYTHEESDIDTVIAAYEEVLPILGRAVQDGKISERLHGKPVEPIFRDSVAGNRTAASGPGGSSAGTGSRLGSVHTANFGTLLQQLQSSLLVTTYQAGKLVVLRHDSESASVNTHFAGFAKPMGLAVAPNRIAVGTALGIFELHNVPTITDKLKPTGRYDACFLPRGGHVTGDIAIHEMAYAGDELWFVNTRFSCLCVHDGEHSFIPRWRPRFITRVAPEDRCHLNGIGVVDGLPRYVTAHGATDTAEGWRETKRNGGILIDIESQEIIARKLSMPHSPRWHAGRLWVLDSGRGGLGYVDLQSGRYEAIVELPGFTRGLDFAGDLAFVGLSQVRESAFFSGIPISEKLKPEDRVCGVWVVDIFRGVIVAFLKFERDVEEIFAVSVMHGIRYPELTNDDTALIGDSFVLPDGALQGVPDRLWSPSVICGE